MGNIQALSGIKAISGPGGLICVNAAAGQLGSLGQGVMTGPGTFRLDLNLVKRVRINERISMQYEYQLDQLRPHHWQCAVLERRRGNHQPGPRARTAGPGDVLNENSPETKTALDSPDVSAYTDANACR